MRYWERNDSGKMDQATKEVPEYYGPEWQVLAPEDFVTPRPCPSIDDAEYVAHRLEIGHIHVRIGLPVRYPLSMIDVIMQHGEQVAAESSAGHSGTSPPSGPWR